MNYTTPFNPLYLEYKQNGTFQLLLLVYAVLFGTIGAVGMIFNASVCYITAKYVYQHAIVHSKTGLLIALNCLFEILHQSSHVTYLAMVLFKGTTEFTTFQSAFFIQCYAIVGFLGAVCMLLSLSADRLLAVITPIFYRNVKRRFYLIGHLFGISLLVSYYLSIIIAASIEYPDWMVTGSLGDFFSAPGIGMSIYSLHVAIMGIAICAYIFVALIVNCKNYVNNEHSRKLFRSIFLIVSINIVGYFLCNFLVTLVLLSIINLRPFQLWVLNNLTAIGLNVAAASNAPILFLNSSEYHEAYSKEIREIKFALLKFVGKNHQIPAQHLTKVKMTTMHTQLQLQSFPQKSNCPKF